MSCRFRRPALLLTAIFAGAGCHGANGPQAVELPPIDVPVATPVERRIVDYEEYPGKIMAVERVSLMAQANGYLTEIRFQPGQLVKAGDVLFVIDDRTYKAALEIAKGQLLQCEARADRLAKEYARIDKLIGTGAATKEEFDRTAGDLAEARANVVAAKATVRQHELNLEYTTVKAPIDGRVGRQMVTVGTDIVSVDRVYVYFDAPESDALRYRRAVQNKQLDNPSDNKIEVGVGLFDETGFPHQGVIDFIPERLEAGTGTQTFRAIVPNPNRALFAEGMFARVRVAFSRPYTALAVADRAVVTNQGTKILYVVDDKDVVMERPVELGRLVAPGLRHVRSGLKPTDRVAVANLHRLMPGAKVVPALVEMPVAASK
jgi:multidrug efflux system membrane fusion protein